MLKISVIMPTYNSAHFISKSIESVLSQTYPNWELIIVDDGSTDNTRDIVNKYIQLDKRIKYFFQQNKGVSSARNKGISISNGVFVAFLDSDDLWLPQKIAIQTNDIVHYNADLVCCDAYHFSTDFTQYDSLEIVDRQILKYESYYGISGIKQLLSKNPISTLTVMCKRESVLTSGGFSENLRKAEDYHLWNKLLFNGFKILKTNDKLAAYRVHDKSLSSDDRYCLREVVDAHLELRKTFPRHKAVIELYLDRSIKKSLPLVYESPDYFRTLSYYLSQTNRHVYVPCFFLLSFLNLRSLSLRASYFIFNYL